MRRPGLASWLCVLSPCMPASSLIAGLGLAGGGGGGVVAAHRLSTGARIGSRPRARVGGVDEQLPVHLRHGWGTTSSGGGVVGSSLVICLFINMHNSAVSLGDGPVRPVQN